MKEMISLTELLLEMNRGYITNTPNEKRFSTMETSFFTFTQEI